MIQKKNRVLIALISLFILPVLIALGFYLFENTLPIKQKNYGNLLSPPIRVEISPIHLAAKWHLVFLTPQNCDQACVKTIKVLSGIHSLLGENSLRAQKRLIQRSQLQAQYKTQQMALNTLLSDNTLLIIDPHHHLLMTYTSKMILDQPQKILSDLKHLLKVSQIG